MAWAIYFFSCTTFNNFGAFSENLDCVTFNTPNELSPTKEQDN